MYNMPFFKIRSAFAFSDLLQQKVLWEQEKFPRLVFFTLSFGKVKKINYKSITVFPRFCWNSSLDYVIFFKSWIFSKLYVG